MKWITAIRQQVKSPGLKVTMVGAVLVTISTTAAIVYVPWALTSKRNIDTIVGQVNQEIAIATSQEVERLFSSAQSAQQLIHSSFAQNFIDLSNHKEQEAFFLSALQANPNFTWIQLGFANGDFVGAQRTADGTLRFHLRDWNEKTKTTLSTIRTYQPNQQQLRLIGTETAPMKPAFYAPSRPWYQDATKTLGQPAWTVYAYRTTNAPGMDVTISLEKNRKTVGVIGVGIELTQLSEYLQKLKGRREGEVFIVNAKNELIASTDPSEINPAKPTGQPQLKQLSAVNNPLLQYADQTVKTQHISLSQLGADKGKSWQRFAYTDPKTGENYFISLTPLGYLDWVVGTVIPEANYTADVNRDRQLLFGVIAVFILTTAGLAIVLIDRIFARPILCVTSAAADIEASKYEQGSLTNVAKRSDELGQLARVFQNMAQQIYMREQKLKQQVKELRIEIDEVKRQKQVKDIVESDFFQDLVSKAQTLRQRNQPKIHES